MASGKTSQRMKHPAQYLILSVSGLVAKQNSAVHRAAINFDLF
jgi:hypothetical protein